MSTSSTLPQAASPAPAPGSAAAAEGPAPLRARLGAALPVAMKSRDRIAVAALRTALAALDNAEAVDRPEGADRHQAIELVPLGAGASEVARRELTEQQVADLVRAEVTERESAAAHYEELGRAEQAERLRAEAAVLAGHLDAGRLDAGGRR
jgi:uncharacterized protein YqeY